MTKLAISVSPEGEATNLDLDNGSLEVLQKAVGGLIQPVDIDAEMTMWVNEEFVYSGFEINPLGSAFFAHIGGTYSIRGTVVFTGGVDPEGYTLGLSENDAVAITNLIEDAREMLLIS